MTTKTEESHLEEEVINIANAILTESDKKEILNEIKKQNLSKIQLNELKLSWAGKLFFAGVAAYLGGSAYKGVQSGMSKAPKLPIKIRGTKEQIKAVMDAITSSKSFQDEINKPGATIDQVLDKLKLRNLNKQNFEKATNKTWPL